SVADFQLTTAPQTALNFLSLVVTQGDDHVVVGIHECRHGRLALGRAGETAHAASRAASQGTQCGAKVGSSSVTFGDGQLYAGTDIEHGHGHHGLLALQGTGNSTSEAAHQATHTRCQTAHGLVTDNDRRLQVVVSGNTLTSMLVGTSTELAGVALLVGNLAQAALGAVVANGGNHEAVGLLNGQSDQRLDGGYLGGLAKAGEPLLAATVVHCDGA